MQAGGTTTLELTALQRPFLYFPLENHCEQLMHVAPRQRRLGAGVELRLRDTSPDAWARHIEKNIGTTPAYPDLPLDGAAKLARHVVEALA